MPNSYWLGLATIPAAIGAAALLYGLGWLAHRALRYVHNHVRLSQRGVRANMAALTACARSAHWVKLPGNAVIAVLVGQDLDKVEQVRDAVVQAIDAEPRRAPRIRTEETPDAP